MKTPVFYLSMLFFLAVIGSNCTKDGGVDCANPQFSLEKVEPSSNPPGYEIRLTGDGFTNATIVRFDNSASSNTKLVDATTLIATIPNGLLGAVEVSVEDDGCIERDDRFEVFADFPSNIPFSPATIIIPQAASVYPVGNFQNGWVNIDDNDHSIFLEDIADPNGALGPNSQEFHFGGNSFLNENPITGYIRFDENAQTSDIEITIDRSGKSGGAIEIYDGEFIDPASVNSEYAYILLLTSQKDGRQLLFQFGL